MSQNMLFVSVNKSFQPGMTMAGLWPCVERAWAVTAGKAMTCDRVGAVFYGTTIAAWRLHGAYPTGETYLISDGSARPRIALALGEPLPVLPEYQANPSLRRGLAVVELDVDPLAPLVKPVSDTVGDTTSYTDDQPTLKVRFRGRGGCRLHWSFCWRLATIKATDVEDLGPDRRWAQFDLSQLVVCSNCGSTEQDFLDAIRGRPLRNPLADGISTAEPEEFDRSG